MLFKRVSYNYVNLSTKRDWKNTFDDFNENVILIDNEVPVWLGSIEGDEENSVSCFVFFEECILEYFDEHKYIQQLIIPEAPFSQIVKDVADEFVGQRVDFYLPQAKLVIEIDGPASQI